MEFSLTDDQRLLSEGIERLLANTYDFSQRSAYLDLPEGWSRAQWQRYAEMGLLGVPFASSEGGFDGGPAEMMIVMEAFGRTLVLEPFVSTVLLGGGFLQMGGSDEQRGSLIPKIIDGSLLLAFAQAEPDSRYDLSHVATAARRVGDDWILDGHKRHVLHGDSADQLIVPARIAGEAGDRDGLALFLVEASAPGLVRRGYRLQDHTRAAEIWLNEVSVGSHCVIGQPGNAFDLMTRVVNRTVAAICCEAVGAMASACERTADYLKTRKQFGTTLGSLQALQHRAVDMFVQLELARSIAMYGIMASGDSDLSESTRAVAATKVQIGRSSRLIAQETIQMHGGIGMTEEYAIGHYFRRLSILELLFGDTQHHLTSLAQSGGLIPAPTQ
jgi:pimeloyl-CoA dehydrogenase small subunit